MRRAILLEIDHLHRGLRQTSKLSWESHDKKFEPRYYSYFHAIPAQTFLLFLWQRLLADVTFTQRSMYGATVRVGGILLLLWIESVFVRGRLIISFSILVVVFVLHLCNRMVNSRYLAPLSMEALIVWSISDECSITSSLRILLSALIYYIS